ncbi:methionyl-tRNA formyltransferase [Candidatus Fermentibacteria bacterium]|nr:MAG: methionyl-tRNA formyltransferase [Candidatus Fermentibacteria bacterium]
MKTVFLGTSVFAVPALEALAAADDINVAAVVSRPDRPAGRGRKLRKPPVAEKALELGLNLLQPEKLKGIQELVEELAPEVMVSASYGGWLPEWFLKLSPFGVVNIHPSLLPRHRGAAPVIRAVLQGDSETGVCFMLTDNGWDTGDVIRCVTLPVPVNTTAGELENILAVKAAEEIPGVLRKYLSGELQPQPQAGEESYAEKISAEEAQIDWTLDSRQIVRQIMAFNPVPGARTVHCGRVVKIYRAVHSDMSGTPGEVIGLSPPAIACGTGAVEIHELQVQGRKRMSWQDFTRGYRLEPGERLG